MKDMANWMSSEHAFAAWVAEGALWSQWAKPIAFVQADGGLMSPDAIADATLPAVPGSLDSSSALVVNLAGAEAVYTGLSLADRGFRPVPLFNGTSGRAAVVDVAPIAQALWAGAERMKHRQLSPDAPPAFLLDSRRRGSTSDPPPGAYDNRWIALPQDFPSGALLGSRGIRAATLIQRGSLAIPSDLAHVLRRWQDSGLQIRVVDLDKGHAASDVVVPRPSHFKLAWYAAIALLGLRRNNVGGFGSAIPEATARSGFHG
jgi:hypothetical protein